MKKLLSLSVLIAMLWGCCNVEDTPKTNEKPANYIVTFDANGGKGIMPEQVFISGTIQELNTNSFENGDYVFTYWNTEADGTGATYVSGNYYSLTSDITLYAQWEIDNPENKDSVKTYTVTFDANGGSGIMPEQVFISGTTQVLNTNVFENGDYVFTYWNTEADGTGATYVSGNYYSLTSDITLYAQWKQNENEEENPDNPDNPIEMYTVTFNANDGTEKKSTQIFISGKKQSLNTNYFNYNGYTFIGWNTETDGNGTAYTDSQSISITSDLVLYAQWKQNENEEETPDNPDNPVEMYTVTFNANDGTEKKSTQIFISEKKQSLNTNYFNYSGYTFTGWNTEAEGNGTAYTDSQVITITSDLTLYAQWKLNESEEDETPNNPTQMYTVTFNANDGTEKKSTQIFISEKKQNLNTNYFNYSGYTFTGWNTEAEGNGTAYTDSQVITITSDLTLYAQWKLNESEEDETPNNPTQMHTVTFNSNGGSGIMSEQSFIDNIPQPLNTNIFKRTGYVFREWNTSPDGNGTTYMSGNYYLLNDNITLYAQWTAVSYTITYNLDEGTNNTSNPTNYTIETETITLIEGKKKGMEFIGWYTDSTFSEENKIFEITKGSVGNIILYAKWRATIVGDIAYSDGSLSAEYDNTKQAVGIVIAVNNGVATKIVSLSQTSKEYSSDATKWCDNYTDAAGNSQWYLPTKNELNQLYLVKDYVNATIDKIIAGGGTATKLGTGWYWSSSLNADGFTWGQNFSDGSQYYRHEYKTLSVRAVRAF